MVLDMPYVMLRRTEKFYDHGSNRSLHVARRCKCLLVPMVTSTVIKRSDENTKTLSCLVSSKVCFFGDYVFYLESNSGLLYTFVSYLWKRDQPGHPRQRSANYHILVVIGKKEKDLELSRHL